VNNLRNIYNPSVLQCAKSNKADSIAWIMLVFWSSTLAINSVT